MPVAIGDSSDDSSSDDEASAEVETQMAVAIGDSSDDEASAPASSTARGQCAMRTWPCPRCYAANLQDRVRFGMLKPEDWSKEKVAQEMRSALQQRKLLPLLCLGCALKGRRDRAPNTLFFHCVISEEAAGSCLRATCQVEAR